MSESDQSGREGATPGVGKLPRQGPEPMCPRDPREQAPEAACRSGYLRDVCGWGSPGGEQAKGEQRASIALQSRMGSSTDTSLARRPWSKHTGSAHPRRGPPPGGSPRPEMLCSGSCLCRTSKLTDAGRQWRRKWKLTRPARIWSGDLVGQSSCQDDPRLVKMAVNKIRSGEWRSQP